MIRTPEYVVAMTGAEYKAWVERGEFPGRLAETHKRDRAHKWVWRNGQWEKRPR